jgi:hypothetical protein
MRRALFVALLLALALPVGAGPKPTVKVTEGFPGPDGCIHFDGEEFCLLASAAQKYKMHLGRGEIQGTAHVRPDGGVDFGVYEPQPAFQREGPMDQTFPVEPDEENACADIASCGQRCSGMCDGAGHGSEVCKVGIAQHGDGTRTCYADCCGDLAGAVCFVTCGPPQ